VEVKPQLGLPLHFGIAVVIVMGLAPSPLGFVLSAAGHRGAIVRLPKAASQSHVLPDAEARLLAMVNRERRIRGLSPLVSDSSLRLAARHHARDMALRGYVGHDSLRGQTMRARLAGFLRPGPRIGENVAMVQSVEEGHRAFVASQPHLQNMLDPRFHRVGIGVTTAGEMGIMITEDFS
jgi:uncharacterized protein YkwD